MTTTRPRARLIYSASESDANTLWATGFFAPGLVNGRMQGFFHRNGHGLELDIHETPGIGSRNHTILKTGHVVTVEPGLYYPGMGGVCLEDVVLVTKTGCRNLVRIPKILEV